MADACGAGRFRGGLGMVRDYRFLAEDCMLQVRSDRASIRPYGLYGGKPGTPSANILNPGENARALPSKFTLWPALGDVFRCQLAGGGGWGDPLERDPARVLRDVRDDKITVEFAAREHGVVIDTTTWTVDSEATVRLRAAARARGAGS